MPELPETEVVKVPCRSSEGLTRYVVKVNGKEIGLLEKYKTIEKGCVHPWKAFKGIGKDCTFLKSFYPEEGGRDAAIKELLLSYMD